MGNLTNSQGSQYTDEQRRLAAVLYADKGNISYVARETDIPRQTINGWQKKEWWESIVSDIRHEKQDEHIALYQEVSRRSLELALDGLRALEGSELKASDIKALAVTGATATDKTRLLLNQPTSIKADTGGFDALAKQFAELSRQYQEKQANVVSVQVQGQEHDENG